MQKAQWVSGMQLRTKKNWQGTIKITLRTTGSLNLLGEEKNLFPEWFKLVLTNLVNKIFWDNATKWKSDVHL